MASLSIGITTKKSKTRRAKRKMVVEMDADKFERVAASFGMFNGDFVKSLERAEKDYTAGRIKKVTSLKDLR